MIEVAPRSGIIMQYEEAILYCTFCRHDGHNDWRMPTKEEYKTYIESWCWNETPLNPGSIWSYQPITSHTGKRYMVEYAPTSAKHMTYEEALLYCAFCNYNEHTDWRIPTRDERDVHVIGWGWYLDSQSECKQPTTPVRDI